MSENRVGKNIKALRKHFGESQEELANAINTVNTAISNYEKGIRQPDYQTLKAIASHYSYPISMIINVDLEFPLPFPLLNEKKPEDPIDFLKTFFEALFPTLTSAEAEKDTYFYDAYYIKKIIKKGKLLCASRIEEVDEIYSKYSDTIMRLYQNSFEEKPSPEAAANLLSCIIEKVIYLKTRPRLESFLCGDTELNYVDCMKLLFGDSAEGKNDELSAFLEDNNDRIARLESFLKQTALGSEIADYYIGLSFMIGIEGVKDTSSSYMIGNILLFKLASIGNSYALNLVKNILEQIDFQ